MSASREIEKSFCVTNTIGYVAQAFLPVLFLSDNLTASWARFAVVPSNLGTLRFAGGVRP
jgi:hypothetical protein